MQKIILSYKRHWEYDFKIVFLGGGLTLGIQAQSEPVTLHLYSEQSIN